MGGTAKDGSQLLLKVELLDEVVVAWRCASDGDPRYLLDTERQTESNWCYRRVPDFIEGFDALHDLLHGLSIHLRDSLED